MDPYIAYYESQLGGGRSDGYNSFGRIYIGTPYQRGHGIGSFLGGLLRRAMPLITSGARAVGKEALRAGMNILSDGAQGVPLKDALEHRLTESGLNLKRKAQEKIGNLMRGSGYKAGVKRIRGIQSRSVRSSRRIAPRKKSKARVGGKKKSRALQNKKTSAARKRKTKAVAIKRKPRQEKTSTRRRNVRDIFGPI